MDSNNSNNNDNGNDDNDGDDNDDDAKDENDDDEDIFVHLVQHTFHNNNMFVSTIKQQNRTEVLYIPCST